MKRRLFIAISLDSQTRKAIGNVGRTIEGAFSLEQARCTRFTPEENWHITISFLGTQDDANLTGIMAAARKAAKEFPAINISFTEISYVPRKDNPRMIWLRTSRETSQVLEKVQNLLEGLLDEEGIRFEQEARQFSGHLTLARFSNDVLGGGLPPIERMFKINYVGTSLDLMESELGQKGAKYTILQKFPFSEE